MILPINYVADWRYIRHLRQTQITKDIARENNTRIDHNCRVGDKVMKMNRSEYKYEIPFKGPYEIVHTWTNGTVTLQKVQVTHRVKIRNIKT